mmetsp:Transcript_18734/g.51658  ORF Transcript_18734/g.51658 Transcript_18734/m.51658 type:complete len:206 (-) Transcript_18734:328-945(-)
MADQFQHIGQCKFVERRSGERKACKCVVTLKAHRRGYPSVACSVGHTWVWCKFCCTCQNHGDREGCLNAAHWFERDSYDTGSRNHMQRHKAVEAESVDSKKRGRSKEDQDVDCDVSAYDKRQCGQDSADASKSKCQTDCELIMSSPPSEDDVTLYSADSSQFNVHRLDCSKFSQQSKDVLPLDSNYMSPFPCAPNHTWENEQVGT